jgi:vancomycin resistance protein YoaR
MRENITAKPVKKTHRPAIIAGVVVISALAVVALIPVGYLLAYGNRVLSGITANGVRLGGYTREAAAVRLNAEVAIFEKTGLNFTDGKRVVHVDPLAVAPDDPDAAFEIFSLDTEVGSAAAFGFGHRGGAWQRLSEAASALWQGHAVTIPSSLDEDRLEQALRKIWSDDEQPVVDSRLDILMDGNRFVSAAATADKSGFRFDYDRAVSDFKDRLANLDKSPITLQAAKIEPSVTVAQAETAVALLPQALKLAPLTLMAEEKRWTINSADLARLLKPKISDNGKATLALDEEAVKRYFRNLAEDYDIAPSDTHLEIDPQTKQLTEFKAGRDGRRIDVAQTVILLEQALTKQLKGEDGRSGFNIVAIAAKSQATTQSAAELGIKEVIGIGRSDFSGSSATRIKNIRHGTDKLNGVLIAPDSEFSALGALEPVTIEDGYLPEQIILGDKIEPGVGGGLCQIGTTLFRMAMNTGLPITERQNHSLVVHYYSDPTNGNPGTDATLYGPHPDLRFMNDTGHWMLLTTEMNIKTKTLTYTLWGTSDGRHGSYTPPKVTNWIAAPTEVRNVEDPTLKPDEQKCQNAFRGANTTFTYTIVSADGTVTQRDFVSHYRALPKICMVGAAEPTTPENTEAKPLQPGTEVSPPANADLPPEAAVGN